MRIAAPGRAPAAGAANQVVPVGSIVTTAAGGRAALFNGAQRVTLGPNSRMTIAPEQASGVTRIMQDLGSVLFQVDKKPAQHFRVETPLLAAIVKGTTFTVNVDVARDSVHVAEGLVEVRANQGGAARDVGAGATGVIAREAPAQLNVSAPSAALEPTVEPLQLGALDYTAVSGGLVDGPGTAAGPVTPGILSRSGDAGPAPGADGAAGPAGVPGAVQSVVLAAHLQPPSTPPGLGGAGGPPANGNSAGSENGATTGNAGGNGNSAATGNGNAGGGGNGAANGNGNAGSNGNAAGGGNGNGGAAGSGNGNGNAGANGNAGGGGNGVAGGNGNGAANGNGNAGSNGNAGGVGNGAAGGN
ncbi:FecR family protein, partial [Phenylobacterium sp.]|uniref:FecR family protein n=1 Tax=Phenylobacterium sp. TaxID=1871053 RepID=UPI0025D91F8C